MLKVTGEGQKMNKWSYFVKYYTHRHHLCYEDEIQRKHEFHKEITIRYAKKSKVQNNQKIILVCNQDIMETIILLMNFKKNHKSHIRRRFNKMREKNNTSQKIIIIIG